MANQGRARKKGKKGRKIGRNTVKCAHYRACIGKPRGVGKPGCKAGKKWTPVRG